MPRPVTPNESFVDFTFPIKGIDLSQAYSRQQAETTPIGQNVRAYDALQARARGGSRPGLAKYITGLVGGGGLVQELNSVVGVGYTPPGPTGVSGLIQASGTAMGAGSQSGSFLNPTTPGNGILVIVGIANGGFATSVTDPAGNTYTSINGSSLSICTVDAYLATGTASTSGFTANINPAYAGVSVVAFEIQSPATSDVQALRAANSNPGASNTMTTTNANDFAYVAVQTVAGAGIAVSGGPGGSWINPSGLSTGGTFLASFQNLYSIVTNLTGTWTFTGGLPDWSSIIGSFKV